MSKQQARPKPAKKQQRAQKPVVALNNTGAYISVTFTVCGPFETPIKLKGQGAISFPSRNPGKLFALSDAKAYAEDVGCYVMARQFGDSFTPIYVGKTTRNFEREVFDVDKREKYLLGAQEFSNGKLVLFLLIPQTEQTFGRADAIRDLERYLVEKGKEANPNLQNQRLVPKRLFRIAGIHNATPGQPRKEVQLFRKMMGNKSKAKAT